MEDKLRFTISGNTNGHNVVTHIYDSDLEAIGDPDSDSEVIKQDVGVVGFLISQLTEHGILGYERGGTNQSNTGASNSGSNIQSERWQCPVHGGKNIGNNFFDKTKLACQYHEVARDWNKPEWASKDAPSGKKGTTDKFWFCKHKEY